MQHTFVSLAVASPTPDSSRTARLVCRRLAWNSGRIHASVQCSTIEELGSQLSRTLRSGSPAACGATTKDTNKCDPRWYHRCSSRTCAYGQCSSSCLRAGCGCGVCKHIRFASSVGATLLVYMLMELVISACCALIICLIATLPNMFATSILCSIVHMAE